MFFTQYDYQVQILNQNGTPNWLFLPGGPGLGSNYLIDFCQKLSLPGTQFLADFPKDGTNPKGILHLDFWKTGLLDLLKLLNQPILVTHSFSGMFVLDIPEIEELVSGLVLMSTTCANTFFEHIHAMQASFNLPDLTESVCAYHLSPSKETFRAFWETYKYYCFTANELPEGEKMIQSFAFNSDAYYFAIQTFYNTFHYRWYSKTLPLLILSGEFDYICPNDVFQNNPDFTSPNVLHRFIKSAGHCPWISNIQALQNAFDDFLILSPVNHRKNISK